MSEETYYVVKAEPCGDITPGDDDGAGTAEWCKDSRYRWAECFGCLLNGFRVVPDTAIEVEPGWPGTNFTAWVPAHEGHVDG